MRIALTAAALLLPAAALADTAEAPSRSVEEIAATCAACHGGAGVSQIPTYPTLAGQHASYLAHALREYRSGKRKNAIMAAQATNLSDDEIAELAAYYAQMSGPLYVPEYQD